MQIVKDHAIILNKIRHKDRNFIVKALTLEHGVQSFFITIPTKKGKGNRMDYQPFSILELVYQKSNKSDLYRIKEASHLHLLMDLKTDVIKNAMAFLLAEIYGQCLLEESKNEGLFRFIERQILRLDLCSDSVANYHLFALVELMAPLGILPEVQEESGYFDIREGLFSSFKPSHPLHFDENNSQLLKQLISEDWSYAQNIALSGKVRSGFLAEIMRFYQYHIPGFKVPKSLDVLQEVFAD